jgi:DUF1009 family protein
LPALLVAAARGQGRDVFVLALEGQTDAATLDGVDHGWVKLGAVGKAMAILRRAEVKEIVLAGRIKRPSLFQLGFDAQGARWLAKFGRRALGDDSLLTSVIRELEDEGFAVVSTETVLGHMMAPKGPIGNLRADADAQRDIERGVTVARALGAVDVGQSVVVQQGIVLGVEAVEGTDALIERCGGLRRPGKGGVLVKLVKPGQDRRADLPVIGVVTIATAAQAGLSGIAIEAGGALIIDGDAVGRAADRAGLFLIGIDPDPVAVAADDDGG